MPLKKPEKVSVACPKCGHVQEEPRTAYSSVCRNCREHFRVQDLLHPAPKPAAPAFELKEVACFQCGTLLQAPAAAESTMCKRCSAHVDLRDYQINQAVSKNFLTKGRLVIEERGNLFNSESRVGSAVIKGRFLGKIFAENTLELHATAIIKGSFAASNLVIPVGQRFHWPERVRVLGAEIGGEWAGNLEARETVVLRAGARFFGELAASKVVVEAGAVLQGFVRAGARGA